MGFGGIGKQLGGLAGAAGAAQKGMAAGASMGQSVLDPDTDAMAEDVKRQQRARMAAVSADPYASRSGGSVMSALRSAMNR